MIRAINGVWAPDVTVNPSGFIDVYINNMIALYVDTPGLDNKACLLASVPMAIHVVARPIPTHKPLPQDPMVMKKKLTVEAGPAEHKVILGWLLNFRCMTVALTKNKFLA